MKHSKWVRQALCWGAVVLLVGACSGGSDDDDDDGNGGGTGSPSCQQWQQAICDLVERCGADPRTCREQATAVACVSDAEAERCSAALAAATCDGPLPSGCDLPDIADPGPAIEKCELFIETLCNRGEECEPGSRDQCVTDVSDALPCSQALGIKPAFDQCLSDVAVLDCDATSSPPACQGVILFSQ